MRTLRYDWYGALAGAGLPLLGTALEAFRHFHSVAPQALLEAHAGQPLLWIMDTTPIVLGLLGRIILSQHEDLVRSSAEVVRIEQARREGFERTARELAGASRGLLGAVAELGQNGAEVAEGVRETTVAMGQLSQAASSASLTGESVIGAALRAERAGEEGIRKAEKANDGLLALADEVRALAVGTEDLARRLREGGDDAKRQVERALVAATEAARQAGDRARAGAKVAAETAETIRALADGLDRSVDGVKEMARAAQQQEAAVEQVHKAMKAISNATRGASASVGAVEREARALSDLAAALHAGPQG